MTPRLPHHMPLGLTSQSATPFEKGRNNQLDFSQHVNKPSHCFKHTFDFGGTHKASKSMGNSLLLSEHFRATFKFEVIPIFFNVLFSAMSKIELWTSVMFEDPYQSTFNYKAKAKGASKYFGKSKRNQLIPEGTAARKHLELFTSAK